MSSKSLRAHGTPPLLSVYLNDHLAGATGGTELLRRAARSHRDTEFGPPLAALAEEVAQDRESLREIMTDLGVPVLRHRAAVGWLGEKAGRLKPNGRLVSRSPLSDLVELEAMRLGVEGKLCAWRSLLALADTDPRIGRARVGELLGRAERQIETLDALRDRCAATVLATDLAATATVAARAAASRGDTAPADTAHAPAAAGRQPVAGPR
ncbi:hypothetical protein [Streptomyces sp. NPDC047000]|uniref:hypothetical protein n=1 Tax=Streptomyces sp. NPDC047000 TaxID=3155474 RepID=UPI0033CC1389